MEKLLGSECDVHIILQRPQLAENIGMCVRAMVNCGFYKLRLINPRCGWPNKKIDLSSAEKLDLVHVELYDSLKSAIADMNLVLATTARSRDMIQEVCDPTYAADVIKTYKRVGIVFGPEDSGLSNEDVALCNYVISIPSIGFRSYNLAQAVLIVCYTIMNRDNSSRSDLHLGKTRAAQSKDVINFIDFLDATLVSKSYFKSDKKHTLMMQTLQNLILRAKPTEQEVNSLFGAIKCLIKS